MHRAMKGCLGVVVLTEVATAAGGMTMEEEEGSGDDADAHGGNDRLPNCNNETMTAMARKYCQDPTPHDPLWPRYGQKKLGGGKARAMLYVVPLSR
jgi:hypothetical protein